MPVFASTSNFCLVLRVGQAGHAAHDRDAAVGADVAVDAGLGAQRRVARLAHHDDLAALAVVHVGVAGGRPLDRGAGHVAEPGERLELVSCRYCAHIGTT